MKTVTRRENGVKTSHGKKKGKEKEKEKEKVSFLARVSIFKK